MKKHLLLLSALLLTACAFSQIPGYQGKKFSIKYDCGINHPALVGRTGSLPMLYHNLSFEYVVSRAWSIGLQYGFMTYKAAPDRKVFSQYNSSYESSLDRNNYKGRYTQHTVSFIAKKFFIRKGYLAPVGRYLLLGCYYQYATDHFAFMEQHYNSTLGYYTYDLSGKKAIAHYGGLTIGMGRNFVMAKRMLIDLGFTLSFSPYIRIEGEKVELAMYRDLTLRNLFQLHLGIGALAF
jgi:hypothetical protein